MKRDAAQLFLRESVSLIVLYFILVYIFWDTIHTAIITKLGSKRKTEIKNQFQNRMDQALLDRSIARNTFVL